MSGTPPQGSEYSPHRLRLIIAEDDPLLCQLLQDLLGEQFEVVASFADGDQLLRAVSLVVHDILLLDITMPVLTGLAVARQLRSSGVVTPIIFVTEHGEPEYIEEAQKAGANGYVLKRRATSDLVTAVESVAAGGTYVSPGVRAFAGN